MDSEIRHVTGNWLFVLYIRGRSSAGFWGPILFVSLSFLCWKFLNTIVCYRKFCHLGGDHDPQPSLDPPLLVMKHEV